MHSLRMTYGSVLSYACVSRQTFSLEFDSFVSLEVDPGRVKQSRRFHQHQSTHLRVH